MIGLPPLAVPWRHRPASDLQAAVKAPATAPAHDAGVPHSRARFADPLEVAPGAVVVPSFHGDDAAPFLVPVHALVLRSPGALVVLGGMPLPATERLWAHVDPTDVRAVVVTRPAARSVDDVRCLLAVCRSATAYCAPAVAALVGERCCEVGPGGTVDGLEVTAAPGGDLGVLAPDLGLWWSSSAFPAPVRHPVVDAADLDDRYWDRQLDRWAGVDVTGVRALRPAAVVPGHGVVLRGDRLAGALAGRDGPPAGATVDTELAAAIADLALGPPPVGAAFRLGP